MITIRRALVDDVLFIAEGIYRAFLLDKEENEQLHTQWIEILQDVCAQPNTHYSYTNTFIAEVNGSIAGMMIAVDGEHYREQRDRMYPQLKSLFDVAFGVGWDDMEDEAQPGEFYIDSLSVAEPCRNQGVGTALIEHAKNVANQLHIPTVTLAVEPMNTAQKLYRQLGFRYQRTITIFNEEYHLYAIK